MPSFLAGKGVSLSNSAGIIASADFNNDGKRDIAHSLLNSSYNWDVEVKLGDANGKFTTAGSVSPFVLITSLTVADFNSDGNVDLLATHRLGTDPNNGFSLLTGDGSGGLVKSWTITTEGEPSASVAGDFNMDDRMDFAVTNYTLNTVTIYYGDGDGNFPTNDFFTVGNNPNSIDKADFNSDGKLDLIINNNSSPSITVLLSKLEGGFKPPFSVSLANDTNAGYVSVGDINGDGKIDAVVGGVGNNSPGTSILIGDGTGNLTLQPFLASDAETNGTLLSDLNGDGKLDLLGNSDHRLSSIRLGRSDGTFSDELTFASAGVITSQVVEDFNGDGKADLAQIAGGIPEFQLFFGEGNGHFGTTTIPVGGRPNSSTVADFNNDGKPDIAVGNYDLSNVQVMTNNGNGIFAITATFSLPDRPWSVFSADFNNDGKVDLGAITWETGSLGAGKLAIMLNNGNGFSEPALYFDYGLRFLRAVAVGDVTNDGILDIVIAYVDSAGSLLVKKGNGAGGFSNLLQLNVGQPGSYVYTPWDVAIGDFNRDGKNDIAATSIGRVFVYLNNGAGGFSQPTLYPAGNPVAELVVADFNEDGILDAAVTNSSPNNSTYNFQPTLSILLGNGTGGFLEPTTYKTGRSAASIATGDFNNDGHIDLAIANSYKASGYDSRVGILYGNGTGDFSETHRFVAGLNAFDVSVADFNADGKLDIATPNYWGGNVSILLNDCLTAPPSNFPALSISDDITVTETDAGTANASFTVSLSAPSSRQVRVGYYTAAITAIGSKDYQPITGTLVFEPNEVSKTITIPVKGDTTDEFDESFNVYLVNPVNASLSDGKAVVKIKEDDDFPPSVSVSDMNFTEGSNGTVAAVFPITLSEPSGKPLSLMFTATSGTATADVDFVSVSGTLNIPAGSSGGAINITINSDTLVEPDETFFITLNNPINVSLGRAQAVGKIVNDDIGGNVQFGNGGAFNVAENAGTALITITRANGAASGVVVHFEASNGSAIAEKDYSPVSGNVTFGANETSKTFTIPIINDLLNEELIESINLSLTSVTGGATLGIPANAVLNISDDDPLPKIRINNVSLDEGNQDSLTATLAVNLLQASGRKVDVSFATLNGMATSPSDYQTVSGILTFAPGEISKTITVQIVGDTNVEPDETFQISLSNPVNATLDNNAGTVTIVNDDLRNHSIVDFDGDGKSDISVFRPSTGSWYLLQSSNSSFFGQSFGLNTDVIVPADYDGDGKTDFAVFRPDSGSWYLQQSTGGFTGVQFGQNEDIPVPADFDGDGKADIAVFRPSTGGWYRLNSSNGEFVAVSFGTSEDKPTVGDFDGDGKADIAVFRPSTANWFRLNSSNNQFVAVQFGAAEDKLTPADFDGDGKTDIAVYRPSTGGWYRLNSSNGEFVAVGFGTAEDKPVPADYDGDGKTDFAVFRPSEGNWYLLRSTAGFIGVSFGISDDKPVPNAYIP